jgi:hypothetical protein
VISLVDRHGLRHEINLDTFVSECWAWVVREEHNNSGIAEHRITVPTQHPIYSMGDHRAHFVAGTTTFADEEAVFDESEEPITCIQCVANATR